VAARGGEEEELYVLVGRAAASLRPTLLLMLAGASST
jgi:hypothetical protein